MKANINSIDKYGRTDLCKGENVTIRHEEGVFEVVGITSQGNVRFLNRKSGQRKLITVEFVHNWILRNNDQV